MSASPTATPIEFLAITPLRHMTLYFTETNTYVVHHPRGWRRLLSWLSPNRQHVAFVLSG